MREVTATTTGARWKRFDCFFPVDAEFLFDLDLLVESIRVLFLVRHAQDLAKLSSSVALEDDKSPRAELTVIRNPMGRAKDLIELLVVRAGLG